MNAVPRIVISAPSSGHGKTAVSIGLLAAFAARGLLSSGFKIGPDHIDAAYLGLATGRPARNLDPSNFTAIDKRQVKTIALPDTSAAYQIASRQDLSALATPPDQGGKLRGRVEIASSDQFWRGSKFLILVQS